MPKRNINLYKVEEEILTQALESEAGIKLRPKGEATKQWATTQRHRLNSCREASRQEAQRLYPDNSAQWGKSPFDALVIRCKQDIGGWYVEIAPQQATLNDLFIEPIKEEE